ncbi:MAG: pantoate--beta-alanine ligase [Candidatus Cloacimonadaceae bacterium]|jgi:pantoate--beta-alanine ligase|nr:pantoate--beta-alanine ligase [Candidatus Cloacimonadota bacterium]MDX9950368.1 pantoate--beta-alanine ligase [Candidatus Syntrophosphaera sp.]NLN85449.1 pantoate--beta-alanine ligase [Candidatus Cloacimonadota bacterium]
MRVYQGKDEIRQSLRESRQGLKVGFVPTMGALHEGHLSLVERCKTECDLCVVSIYVNPAQFGPSEDLGKYPRNLDKDLELLSKRGADLVFFPDDVQMYPPGYRTWIDVEGLSEKLCGASRPGHFRGVATVVLKLCNIVRPDSMYMGLKDFQQIVVLERMLKDLDCETRIVRCPIIREEDGLALSSRNAYLEPDERLRAISLSQALKMAREQVASGTRDSAALIEEASKTVSAAGGTIDYIKIVDADTLEDVAMVNENSRMLLAVFMGKTRLIDNCALGI